MPGGRTTVQAQVAFQLTNILHCVVPEQWADALHSWLGITDQHIHIVHTSSDCRFKARQPKFVITSYNFLGKLKEDIETRDYRIVVVDESHYIKDWKVGNEDLA